MLKEIFLIDRSILQFHYSSERTDDEDNKAILSSGFLSAIQDFSAHTRSDILESFSTENEYFLFQQCLDTKRILVGVFDRRAPTEIARKVLKEIMSVLQKVDMPTAEGLQLSKDTKNRIRDEIDVIQLQFFSSEQLGKIVFDILQSRTDIPVAFLIDITTNSVITRFSRPRPLFKDEQVRDFLLVHSTLHRTLSSLDMDSEYVSFNIESQDYTIVCCISGRLASVASGAMRTPKEDVHGAALSMCQASPVSVSEVPKYSGETLSRAFLLKDGTLRISAGSIPLKSSIHLSTLVNNLDSLSRILTRRSFQQFEVILKGSKMLRIRKSNDEWMIEFLNIMNQ